MRPLTRAQGPLEAQAVEVVTLAVLPPHLAELVSVTGALSAQTVASPAARRASRLWDAVGIVGGAVVLQRALAPRTQSTLVTLANAALVGPVSVAADQTVGHRLRLAVAAAGEVHRDLQGILEAQGFDGKRAALLFRAATQLSLHAERHLQEGSCSGQKGLHGLKDSNDAYRVPNLQSRAGLEPRDDFSIQAGGVEGEIQLIRDAQQLQLHFRADFLLT